MIMSDHMFSFENIICGRYNDNSISGILIWKNPETSSGIKNMRLILDPILCVFTSNGINFQPFLPFSDTGEVLIRKNTISAETCCPENLSSVYNNMINNKITRQDLNISENNEINSSKKVH